MTPEQEIALEQLESAIMDLRRQLTNKRAHHHHKIESAQIVETDARWLVDLLKRTDPEAT